MRHYPHDMEEDIKKALDILRNGGVILYPTDTIWGIGCDATNSAAVNRIYAIKQRQEHKAMLVLLDRADKLERYVDDVPDMAYTLNEISERPITIIYDHARHLAPELLGENDSVGIRISREPFTQPVDYIVGYRQNDKTPHQPSSVVKLSADNVIKILRP